MTTDLICETDLEEIARETLARAELEAVLRARARRFEEAHAAAEGRSVDADAITTRLARLKAHVDRFREACETACGIERVPSDGVSATFEPKLDELARLLVGKLRRVRDPLPTEVQ